MKEITHLVFSGCAFRSFCLLGVLRYIYIEKMDNNIHNVAGSSMGSLFCLLFALKIPIEYVEEILKGLLQDENMMTINSSSFIKLFTKNGVESSMKYVEKIREYVKNKYDRDDLTFLELSKKTGVNLYVSVTNINKNTNYILSVDNTPDVSIFKAVAASMTIPFLAYPIEINGEYYIDGGLTNNFPIKVFKNIPIDNILGVAIKIPDDFKVNEIAKNTEISLFKYISQLSHLIYLNSTHYTLLDHLNDNILIIEESPINDWLDIDITKDSIKKKLSIEEFDKLIIKGYTDIYNYMKKNNK